MWLESLTIRSIGKDIVHLSVHGYTLSGTARGSDGGSGNGSGNAGGSGKNKKPVEADVRRRPRVWHLLCSDDERPTSSWSADLHIVGSWKLEYAMAQRLGQLKEGMSERQRTVGKEAATLLRWLEDQIVNGPKSTGRLRSSAYKPRTPPEYKLKVARDELRAICGEEGEKPESEGPENETTVTNTPRRRRP